ncbi:hypothetical protein MNBD_GAMMA20-1137, partial [hydrothermal vent metagenome]
ASIEEALHLSRTQDKREEEDIELF